MTGFPPPVTDNPVSARKLLHSKWTAARPRDREKHFTVTEVAYDKNGAVTRCRLEALYTRRSFDIDWRALGNAGRWLPGWR